jgi:hypothetical protein
MASTFAELGIPFPLYEGPVDDACEYCGLEMVHKVDGWVGARLAQETMFELLRTPTYSTIQGERWQFCCKRPMIFIGAWRRDEFSRRAPDRNGKRFFDSIVQDAVPGLWEDQLHDVTGVYVFRCTECGKLTAHWDIATLWATNGADRPLRVENPNRLAIGAA